MMLYTSAARLARVGVLLFAASGLLVSACQGGRDGHA